jgi:hypothetical protein
MAMTRTRLARAGTIGVLALLLLAVVAGPAAARKSPRRAVHSALSVSSSPTQVVSVLSDRQAASRVKSVPESRPDNDQDNQNVPTASQLASFRSSDKSMGSYYLDRITGDYRGTTDEIIQWAAYKWGLDPQLLRAVAVVESWWHMYTVGDGGNAYGLFQIDVRYHANQQLAQNDTAFNADYYGAIIRSYYDGTQTWLNTVSGNGARYRAHQLWNSVGYWASGRWDTGQSYVSQVQSDLSQQVWLQPNFTGQ